MNKGLRGGISAGVCALVLAACGGGGGDGDSTAAQATPATQVKDNGVQPSNLTAIKIADIGITPTNALRPGTKVDFVVSGTFPSGTTYAWDFSDGPPLSTGASTSHTYSKVGKFTVKVTATDSSGKKSTEMRTVEIVQNEPPVVGGTIAVDRPDLSGGVSIGTGSTGAINLGHVESTGRSVKVVVNATDPQGDSLTYKWLIDGIAYGQSSTSNTLSYTFSTGGAHVVTVIVMDEYGGQTSHDFPVTLASTIVDPADPDTLLKPTGYAVWKSSYTGQPVGRIRVAANKTAWALPMLKPQVLRSTDNGRSWQELTLPKDERGAETRGFIDVGFADDKNIWVVGCPQQEYVKFEGGALINFDYASAMHSSDGGNSWENVSLGAYLESRCINAVQFAGQNGWVVNERGIVGNTTDGGKTWRFLADAKIDAKHMQFTDAQNGWIVGAARNTSKLQISRTTDGGATWTVSKTPDVEMNTSASLYFVDSKNGYASGSLWSRAPYPVLKTTDGGATWTTVPIPNNTFIRDLAFTTPTSGYALDSLGDVYGTKDGGSNWAKIGVRSTDDSGGLESFAIGGNSALLGTSSSYFVSGNTSLLGSLPTGGGVFWLTPL